MICQIKLLLDKEIKLYFREPNTLIGIYVFNAFLGIMTCALFRNLQITSDELGLIICPYLWIILVLSIFRITLQNITEESKKGLFLKQLRDGFESHQIFLVKILSGVLTGGILIFIQTSVFIWLLGFTEILQPLIKVGIIYFFTLPAIVALSFIGAFISLRSAAEEVLMPIILLPMIILLSISAVTAAEDSFINNSVDFQFYWLKLIIGLQILFVIVSEFLFRIISRLKN